MMRGKNSSSLASFRRQTRRSLAVFVFVVCASVPARAQNVVDIPKFAKVNDHLYRGALPSWQQLHELAQLGIKTVVDLRGESERNEIEEREATGLGLRYVSVPMRGFGAPSETVVLHALDVMQAPANWPVYVHCRYGVDRTGTVIACYRIRVEAWPNEKAKKEAETMGMHRVETGMKSFILHFPGS